MLLINAEPEADLFAYPLWTLQVPSQTQQQLVRDGVHQVEEGGVFVQDIVERRPLEAQILPWEENKRKDKLNHF